MKLTILRKLALPVSLMAVGAFSAYAAPVNCSTITTVAQAIATDFNPTPGCVTGNVVFSNFSFNFTSGTSNQSNTAPALPPASDIAMTINSDGFGDYSVITDFTGSSPLFSVAATQTEEFQLQYVATEEIPATTITGIDGLAQEGIRMNAGSTAVGQFKKTECQNGAYADTGGGNPSPLDICSTSESTIENAIWNQSTSFAGNPSTPANQSQQGHFIDTTSQHLTSVGIYDDAKLNGGATDVPAGGSQAAVGFFENDFTETTVSGTPEPGTFLLLGGALVALGAIRRKKNA